MGRSRSSSPKRQSKSTVKKSERSLNSKPFGRKVAYSNKKKKIQLKAKRERKQQKSMECDSEKKFPSLVKKREIIPDNNLLATQNVTDEIESIISKNFRYDLKFRKDHNSNDKKRQYEPFIMQSPTELEYDIDYFFPSGIDFPQRPKWRKGTSKSELDLNEVKYFKKYNDDMTEKYHSDKLSLYELNLETWRQLWRVIEMSDILLIIVDARYVVAQFPPALYHHLRQRNKKGILLVLNKCDLISPHLLVAWQDYFKKLYSILHVIPFCSVENNSINKRTNLKMASESALRLVNVCQDIVGNEVNLQSWKQMIIHQRIANSKEKELDSDSDDVVSDSGDIDGDSGDIESDSGYLNSDSEDICNPTDSDQRFRDGIVTIGTIGHPNVGKSSIINALMGKKVVSVSKTPGHTKHFQTIFLTEKVKLCDCPGLVFPSLCPKQLQVLVGSFPVAQVRNPINTVGFIAERIDMVSILKLKPAFEDDPKLLKYFKWTPHDICEAWGLRRKYFKTKGKQVDVQRAANELLRFTLVGFKSLNLSLKPPNFFKMEDTYKVDSRQDEIKLVQGVHAADYCEKDSGSCSEKSDNFDSTDEYSADDDENDDERFIINKFSILAANDE